MMTLPRLRPLLRAALPLAGALAVAACEPILDFGGCGPTSRFTSVQGEVRNAAGILVSTAMVRLVEHRDATPRRSISVGFSDPRPESGAPPLWGNLGAVRIENPAGETLYDFAITRRAGSQAIGTEPIDDATIFAAIRREFLASRVSIVIETTNSDRERLRAALPLEEAGQWGRAQCS